MNTYYTLGLFCGVFFAILICTIAFRKKTTGGKGKYIYDERQETLRSKGYKYGFFTLIITNTCYGMLTQLISKPFAEPLVANFICICLGIFVYATYSIWKESYFAINEPPKRSMIIFSVLGLINLSTGIMHIMNGEILVNGILTNDALNLIFGILLVAILLVCLIKYIVTKQEEE